MKQNKMSCREFCLILFILGILYLIMDNPDRLFTK